MRLLDYWKSEPARFDAILFDIDGTVVYGPQLIPGAPEALELFRNEKIPFFFLTNDGNHSREQKCAFLNRAGITAKVDEIISCLSVLPDLAERRGWNALTLFQVGDLGDTAELKLEHDLERLPQCNGIILGEGDYDWKSHWEALADFFRRKPHAPFIVPNPDNHWPSAATGGIGIGAGGQARCIQLILKGMDIHVEPIYFGKPYHAIYDFAARKLGVKDRSRILCVGDSLASDIRGANENGMTSALVLTGITSQEQAEAAAGTLRPNHIFCSI